MIGRVVHNIKYNFLGKKFMYKFWKALYYLSMSGLNMGEGGGIEDSGEINVLLYVKNNLKKEPLIVFDVGANVGTYTNEILHCFQNLQMQIHCFEPAQKTFKELCSRLQGRQNVFLNNFGLSDAITESLLYYDKEQSGLASLYKRQLDYFDIELDKQEKVQLNTIDNYCQQNQIAYIDLLKMDIEGNELNALIGASKMLSSRRIRTIQIEFGGCNIDSRVFIRDFWNLLHEDYYFYRILKDGLVEIEKYDERLENFSCTNYFFVRK